MWKEQMNQRHTYYVVNTTRSLRKHTVAKLRRRNVNGTVEEQACAVKLVSGLRPCLTVVVARIHRLLNSVLTTDNVIKCPKLCSETRYALFPFAVLNILWRRLLSIRGKGKLHVICSEMMCIWYKSYIWSLRFFSGLSLQLIKLHHNCEDHFHFYSLSAVYDLYHILGTLSKQPRTATAKQ